MIMYTEINSIRGSQFDVTLAAPSCPQSLAGSDGGHETAFLGAVISALKSEERSFANATRYVKGYLYVRTNVSENLEIPLLVVSLMVNHRRVHIVRSNDVKTSKVVNRGGLLLGGNSCR